jgi:proteasome assembly chaperone (PAC2) family protein
MADDLRIDSRPALTRPVLIAAFRGWNDGGQGASLAAGYLTKVWDADRFAELEPENFFDFQATRPHVTLVEGVSRRIDWPENVFYHAPIPGADRDAVVLLGVEPNLRWQTFAGEVVRLAQELGVELVVTLGALLADVPHTRPAPVTGSATEQELIDELGLERSRYEGPTGMVGVLHDACRIAGVPSVSLWAAVPHYVSLAPSPRAALALCQRLGDLLEVEIDLAELEGAAAEYADQVTEAVSSDAETQAYVEELEHRVDLLDDAAEEEEPPDVPSGDSIAAELTRYLREHDERKRGDDEPPHGPAG